MRSRRARTKESEKPVDFRMPTWDGLARVCSAYHGGSYRDVFYEGAAYILRQSFVRTERHDIRAEAVAVGVVLENWNRLYYMGRQPDYERLEEVLSTHRRTLSALALRNIASYDPQVDGTEVESLYRDLLSPLSVRRQGRKTHAHVSTAKALHVLAPSFFPPWDQNIADAYGCYRHDPLSSPSLYPRFMGKVSEVLQSILPWNELEAGLKTLPSHVGGVLKLLDEWNYTKFSEVSR